MFPFLPVIDRVPPKERTGFNEVQFNSDSREDPSYFSLTPLPSSAETLLMEEEIEFNQQAGISYIYILSTYVVLVFFWVV